MEAIVAFAAEVVPVHYSTILGDTAAQAQLRWWTSERMKSAVEAEQVHLAVADEAIVGVAETGELGQEHVVWKLYLAPEFRGRALGTALLRHAIGPLRAKTDHVLVEHFAENKRAARFYEREGWLVVRTEAAMSGDPRGTVVWRRLDLEDQT